VCPTGIDIRDGAQLECIQCALCIDACNDIMDRIGRPRDLIAYDTIAKQEAKAAGSHEPLRLIRPRTVLYAALIAVVSAVMLFGLWSRHTLEVNVLRDRGAMFVQLSDGSIRNAYTVKILNKLHEARHVTIGLQGLAGAELSVLGADADAGSQITVPPDNLREVRVLVTVPRTKLQSLEASNAFSLVVSDAKVGDRTSRDTVFQIGQRSQ
jgi:cytochrome c oxidase accessory protein FixG